MKIRRLTRKTCPRTGGQWLVSIRQPWAKTEMMPEDYRPRRPLSKPQRAQRRRLRAAPMPPPHPTQRYMLPYKHLQQLLEAQQWLKNPGVIAGSKDDIPAKKRRQFILQKGQRCVYCETMEALTVDHKVARCLGGTNERGNLQVLCRPCNQTKNIVEQQLLAMLHTDAGRAELLRWWAEVVQAGKERGQARKTEGLAQRQLVYEMLHGKRAA